MRKEVLEIEVKDSVDVVALAKYVSGFKSVKKCYVVTGQSIRIYYNEAGLSAKKLVKLIGAYSNKDHRSKKTNVRSLKQVTDNAA